MEAQTQEKRPKEIAIPCPNCGELHWASALNNYSVKRIDCLPAGSLISTLYGVCWKCANVHSNN